MVGREHSESGLALFQGGAELGHAKAKSEHPEWEAWILGVVRACKAFQLEQCIEQVPVPLLEPEYVSDGDRGRSLDPKEQLKKEFVAGRSSRVEDGEPLLEAGAPGRGSRIFLPPGSGRGA